MDQKIDIEANGIISAEVPFNLMQSQAILLRHQLYPRYSFRFSFAFFMHLFSSKFFIIFLLILDIKYKFHRNYTNFRIKIDDIEFGMVFLSHCHFLVDVANYTTAGSVPQHIRYDEMGIGDDSKKYDINGKTNQKCSRQQKSHMRHHHLCHD